ncbi:hypothetical protein [Chryseobacterium indoltheticum]|uniref:hypothetical protein n=1 Tax=Chryseobacterium indoltheticum TaxID=254 RepID=UPI003F496450
MKYYTIILILLLFSCKENRIDKKIEWDYLNSSFKSSNNQSSLGMLCGYDTFELKRIDDSLLK